MYFFIFASCESLRWFWPWSQVAHNRDNGKGCKMMYFSSFTRYKSIKRPFDQGNIWKVPNKRSPWSVKWISMNAILPAIQYNNENRRHVSNSILTAHNWQKWKSTFITCQCHEIYMEEAVGLKSSNYTWKLWFLCVCEIWGNFIKKFIFCK